jgi:cell division inhibitor SulA
MKLRIGARLGLGFSGVLLLLVLAVGLGMLQMHSVDRHFDSAVKMQRRAALTQAWIANTKLNVERAMAIATSRNDAAVEAHFSPLMSKTSARINELQGELQKSIRSERGQALLAEVA